MNYFIQLLFVFLLSIKELLKKSQFTAKSDILERDEKQKDGKRKNRGKREEGGTQKV